MKVKLFIDRKGDGENIETVFTNLFVITEWERIENRRASDGRGFGMTEVTVWAYFVLKLRGEKLPDTWREWVKENPEMIITSEDKTDINPTEAATVGS